MSSVGDVTFEGRSAAALVWLDVVRTQLGQYSRFPSLHLLSWLAEDVLILCLVIVLIGTIVCSLALWKNYYSTALKVSALRKLREGKPMSDTDKKFKTALQAETVVENLLKQEGWKYVFPNRRVAVARLGHNREIDVIAVGPKILVVEVKHWRGFVWSTGNAWYQCPFRKAKALMFENVYSDNVEKAATLRRFIENQRRIPLPDAKGISSTFRGTTTTTIASTSGVASPAASVEDGDPSSSLPASSSRAPAFSSLTGTWYSDHSLHTQCGEVVIPVVIFTNPDVRLDPNTILKEYPNVFTIDTFRAYLRQLACAQKPWYWRWCRSWMKCLPLIGKKVAPSGDTQQKGKQNTQDGNGSLGNENHASSPTVPKKGKKSFQHRKDAAKDTAEKKGTGEASATVSADKEGRRAMVLLSSETQRKVAEAVDMLRTWDVLHLHNGRIVTGDVQGVVAPSAFCAYERKHILAMRFCWNAGFFGIVKTLITNKSGSVEIVLTAEKRLAIKKKENKPRNAEGNIVFPIIPRHKKIGGSDRFMIRSPGNPAITPIPISDVKDIALSKHLYLTENLIKE